jgi:putative endonuclease
MPLKSDPSTWSDPRQRRGVAGEEIAKEYLVARGWTILEHRFRLGRLEVDLVARRGDQVAFVEVKTRVGNAFGSPLEAVTWSKQREIARVALAWIDRHGEAGDVYRFDVVGVILGSRRAPSVEYVPNAFRAGWR